MKIITEHDTPETRNLARRAGTSAYFHKPFYRLLQSAVTAEQGGFPLATRATRPQHEVIHGIMFGLEELLC